MTEMTKSGQTEPTCDSPRKSDTGSGFSENHELLSTHNIGTKPGTKEKNQAAIAQLVWSNPNAPSDRTDSERTHDSGGPEFPEPARRVAEVRGQDLDVFHSGVRPLFPSDLLDASLWDLGVVGDTGPMPFTQLQLLDDVVVNGFAHSAEGKPVFRFMQPDNGRRIGLRSSDMVGRPQKAVAPQEIISQILIDNVAARWQAAFPMAKTDKERLEALARRSGVGKETVRMMMKGEQSPRVVTLDKIARALGTTAADLLRVSSLADEQSA